MRKFIASAKPREPKVLVNKKVWVYHRIRTRYLNDDQSFVQLMKQVAKVSLRRTIEIFNFNKKSDEGNT